MPKLYVIFNTCGLSGNEQTAAYIQSINSILQQDFDDFRVVVSSCLNSPMTRNTLCRVFGDKVSYNFINDVLPVNITFNHTVMKCVESMGPADGYLYIDSGITFGDNKNVLKSLYDLHKSDSYGMTAGRVDTDAGTFLWFQEGANQHDESGQANLFKNGHFIIPVGKTINLHIQIFDHSIFENFNKRILPDIFASHCTESTFSFVNACLKKKFVLHKDVVVNHLTSMDGASSGFRPEYAGVPGWQHLLSFSHKTIFDIINDPEALPSGFGYEECQNILMHNPDKFDAEGYAAEPDRLKKFLQENIYLPETHFNYNSINHQFIA